MSLDTQQFLNMTTEQDLDTKIQPCPEGEYLAMIGDIEVRTFTYKQGDREGETGYRLVVPWQIEDDNVKEELGRDTVTVTQSLLLDVTPDGNGLDFGKGKNIGLGRLREALGQNEAGKPWSPAMLQGQAANIVVKHEMYKDSPVAQVDAVRPA